MRFPNDPSVFKALVCCISKNLRNLSPLLFQQVLAVWYVMIILCCKRIILNFIRTLLFLKCTSSIHAGYFLAVVKWGDIFALLNPTWFVIFLKEIPSESLNKPKLFQEYESLFFSVHQTSFILINIEGYDTVIRACDFLLFLLCDTTNGLQSAATFLVHLFFAHKLWMRESANAGNRSMQFITTSKVTRKRYWWISTIAVCQLPHWILMLFPNNSCHRFFSHWDSLVSELATTHHDIVLTQFQRWAWVRHSLSSFSLTHSNSTQATFVLSCVKPDHRVVTCIQLTSLLQCEERWLPSYYFRWNWCTYFIIIPGSMNTSTLVQRLATASLCCAIVADWTITISLIIFLRVEKAAQSEVGLWVQSLHEIME